MFPLRVFLRLSRMLPAALICALCMGALLHAQAAGANPRSPDPRHADATGFGERFKLGPEWLFQPGDDPKWAAADYNDSGWRVVSTDKPLADYGIRDIPLAWYRMHVHLRPGAPAAAVALVNVYGSYEVYANGVRIGGNGTIPGTAFLYQVRLTAFPIPKSAIGPDGDLALAIRFTVNPVERAAGTGGYTGRGYSSPIERDSGVYLISASEAAHDSSYVDAHNTLVPCVVAGLSLLTCVVALGLWLALRSRREYLAAAAVLFVYGATFLCDIWIYAGDRTPLPDWIDYALFGLSQALNVEFFRILLAPYLGDRRPRWLLAVQIVVFVTALASPLISYGLQAYLPSLVIFYVPTLAVELVILALLLRSWRAGSAEALVLAPAVLGLAVARAWGLLVWLVALFTPRLRVSLPAFQLGSYQISLSSAVVIVYIVCILLFLVLRTVGIARRHAAAAAELEAAREVQQRLVPVELPRLPGLTIEASYLPAAEVGGDFYQVIEQPGLDQTGGAALIVVGDVSGKGLKAAMTGALAMGSLRALAAENLMPGELLKRLNRLLAEARDGGFITCLCLRIEADGRARIANAGHLAPYCNGAEIVVENGLPLGIVPEMEYAETTVKLSAGDKLMLLSDGVVEATNAERELFGFARTAAHSTESAQKLAETAQHFGQQDDITVLTVALAS